jgi:hypothetical protein
VGRVLETIFRRPYTFLIILLVIPLVSIAVVYVLVPRSYQAQASLWAFQRYAVVGPTGPESDLNSSPAETQATALAELLQTRSFDLTVAQQANLAPSLNLGSSVLSNPVKLNQALYVELSHKVDVTPSTTGDNLLTIDYANIDPLVAQKVVQVVVQDYGQQSTQFSTYEGQQLLTAYQAQLVSAQNAEHQAASTESQYLSSHPSLTPAELPNDPQYQSLHAQTVDDQTNVQNIQSEIATVQQEVSTQGTSADSLFKIVDQAQVLSSPVSRSKSFIYAGGISFAVALLACLIYLIVLLRRNRGIYTPPDLQKVTVLPVLMQLPHVVPESVSYLTDTGLSSTSLSIEKGSSRYLDF